jgi:hypothetical protein
MINIILGVLAAIIWGGAMGWYFRHDARSGWKNYRRRWTRLDQD